MAVTPIVNILSKLRTAQNDYVMNSDFDVLWTGLHVGDLNNYNEYIETINIPERSIQTSDSKVANSVNAKLGTDITVGDMEMSWRLTGDFGVLYSIEAWMKAVKAIGVLGSGEAFYTSGYFQEYCIVNSCRISNRAGQELVTIQGLYPTSLQSISFSSEGGEYLKATATFSCYLLNTMLYNVGQQL